MTDFPRIGAMAGAAIGGASHVRRMSDVDRSQHVLLAQQFEIVVFILAAEALVMVRIIRLWSRRGIQNRIVEPTHATSTRGPGPGIVLPIWVRVAEFDESGAARVLRLQHGV